MYSKPPLWQLAATLAICVVAATGCSPYRNSIPASCIRPSFYDNPRGGKHPINYVRLRQDPPAVYMLGPRDILGVFIEGVLGRPDDAPPVHFPDQHTNLPPSIGFPMPVREDGTLSLPLIPPINVTGLSLAQVEHEIRKAYTIDRQILQPDRARIIVTLMKPRSYSILVVREDSSSALGSGAGGIAGVVSYGEPGRRAQAREVQLKAYENDVLHALVETGGMPGLDSKNEIYIIRGGFKGVSLNEMQRALADQSGRSQLLAANPNLIRVPLRIGPNDPPPTFGPDDIILNNGDVLFLESRGSEVFYTGGLLQGRQIAIPRDYDLDVLGAVCMAGGSVAGSAQGNPFRTGGGVGNIFPPTRVVLVRSVGGQLVTIKLSLRTALTNAQERILVQPNDYVILEYTETEMLLNILLNNVNMTFSLNQLFNR